MIGREGRREGGREKTERERQRAEGRGQRSSSCFTLQMPVTATDWLGQSQENPILFSHRVTGLAGCVLGGS